MDMYEGEEQSRAFGPYGECLRRCRCRGFYHVIRQGDTLYKLSREYGVTVAEIMLANPYINIYNLQIGDEICIPKVMAR